MIVYAYVKHSRTARLAAIMLVVLAVSLLSILPAFASEGNELPAESRHLRVAVDSQGLPWAVWEVGNGSDADIYYSRWTGRAWESPQPVSADPELWEEWPSLAFTPDGTAWVAWAVSTAEDEIGILVSHWEGDRWSTPVPVLGTSALAGRQPALAAAPDGGLWLAWVGHDGTDREIYASHRDGVAHGAVVWSAPEQVGNDDTDGLAYDMFPRLAVDGSGEVWLVWVSYEAPSGDEIHASHWDGTTWSPQQQISTADETPDTRPALTLDTGGQPWVAWQGVPEDTGLYWRVLLSHWDTEESAWTAEAVVSSPSSLEVDEREPSLAFDGAGQLHVAWSLSGELSGIARTGGDGAAQGAVTWSDPTWIEMDEPVNAPVLAADVQAWLFWLMQEGWETAPVTQQAVADVIEPLLDSLAPHPATPATVTSLDFAVLLPLVRSGSNVPPTRHFAHGDSITWGGYDGGQHTPYPALLEQLLDLNVGPAEVINHGLAGKKARADRARLVQGLQTYQPEFVQIMEGTNDITSDYSPDETEFAVRLLALDAKATIPGAKVVVATISPRLDKKNEEIDATNYLIRTKTARRARVPIADVWQAFYDNGIVSSQYYVDYLHPGDAGLQIIADTFYQTMVDAGMIVENP
jgi:lysophospholipase L1-like esterase